MPQVRDPKTGRYTSGGDSSVGGAASTNPRIQKAKAVGGGATAGGANASQGEYYSADASGKVSARNGGSLGDAVEEISGKSMFDQRDAVKDNMDYDVEIETLTVKSAKITAGGVDVDYEYSGYTADGDFDSGTIVVFYPKGK